MTALGYSVRALALSLSLTAAGAFSVVGAVPDLASASPSAIASPSVPGFAAPGFAAPGNVIDVRLRSRASTPVGGQQLSNQGVIVNPAPGVPAPPVMPGASYLVADMDTGAILAARAPHAPHLPASTLKTLTALTLIPLLNANTKILVKPEDVNVDGTHLGIVPGATYSVGTLLQGLLMVSGNDAAWALARGNHSVADTLRAMNATAAKLNAFDTVAKDPSGLDKAGQSTSAYDLALIGRAAMKLPDFRRYVATKQNVLPGSRSVGGKVIQGFKISSHNRLLFNYPGAIGIKTGYTIAAKQTYVGAATRGGKTYIVTQMSSPNGSWRAPAAMLDWAFAHGSSLTPIGKLVEPGTAVTRAQTSVAAVPVAPVAPVAPAAPLARPGSPPPATTSQTAGPRVLPPWVGVTALLGMLGLVGGWTARNLSRQHRRR